jgi:hypothetical protein
MIRRHAGLIGIVFLAATLEMEILIRDFGGFIAGVRDGDAHRDVLTRCCVGRVIGLSEGSGSTYVRDGVAQTAYGIRASAYSTSIGMVKPIDVRRTSPPMES